MTLDSAHALGLALYGLARYEADELHVARAAHGRARTLGPEHPDTVESTACLAESIGEQQRWEEAEALARPNLATSERAMGIEAPRYVFRGPARGPLASGPGMTVPPLSKA